MSRQIYGESFSGGPAENYQRYFVPGIGKPVAGDLIEAADLRRGDKVLDVACGTGVVTRLAAERVGEEGAVTGLDVNPAMLGVARSVTPADLKIDWIEASAESMPLADNAFDVVLCQMGLQFVPDKAAALREMHRVLASGGRAIVTVPGPEPRLFKIMADALGRHLGPEAAGFVHTVFSLHDGEQIAKLMREAGFGEADVQAEPKRLRLPPPADFLWQYIHSTPISQAVAQVPEDKREALERDVCSQWEEFRSGDGMAIDVRVTTASARKSMVGAKGSAAAYSSADT